MMINIPIYRAKKIDSDEYIIGWFCPTIEQDKFFIMDIDYGIVYEIDSSTLSIHFQDMIDSEENKIFASLSDDGKGGDILEFHNHLEVIVFKDFEIIVGNLKFKMIKDVSTSIKITGIKQ